MHAQVYYMGTHLVRIIILRWCWCGSGRSWSGGPEGRQQEEDQRHKEEEAAAAGAGAAGGGGGGAAVHGREGRKEGQGSQA